MTGLLRQAAGITTLSRSIRAASCTARVPWPRPASIPRNLYYTQRMRIRTYATTPPNQPPQTKEQLPLPDGWARLTKEDKAFLYKMLEDSSSLLPGSWQKDTVTFRRVIDEFGAPKEFLQAMREFHSNPGFSTTMKLVPIALRMRPQFVEVLRQLQERQSTTTSAEDTPSFVFNKTESKDGGAAAQPKQASPEGSKDGDKSAESATTEKGEEATAREGKVKATSEAEADAQPQQKTSESPGPSAPPRNRGQNRSSNDESSNKGSSENGRPPGFRATLDLQTILVAAFATYMTYRLLGPQGSSREITWQEFRNNFFDKGLVDKLVVTETGTVNVHLHREAVASMYPDSPAVNPGFYYYFTIGSVEAFERKIDQAQDQLGIPNSERIPVQYAREGVWSGLLLGFGPTLLFIAAIVYMSRRAAGGAGGQAGGIFGMGRSRAKKFNHETDVKVKFADVAGMDEAKQEIMEFVSFLREPSMYQKLGAKIPRGAILSGPPGTGKTLLAKATAGESGVPFFSVSGSEFVEMFVGVGASRVRDLFQNARKNTPCIIFIDEIDAIGKSRSGGKFSGGGNDEREATLNQILTEMDGFNTTEQVVVLAGTNRADILDSALMRPGRFDRHIAIDKPTMEGRKQIFKVHLRNIVTKVDTEYLEGRLAALTPGFSGADIANCVNEAALIAARGSATTVEMTHFEQAIERVIGGLEKRSLVLSPEEKKTVAYHEAGHAVCGWYFRWADPLLKVSIIPRGSGALGYAQYLPAGDTYLLNMNQIMDRLAMTLGGRVSEEIHFDTVTSGASDDFNKVTRMATAMVTRWGMSPKIGYRYYEDDNQGQLHKPFSEETARDIDLEVRRIVDEAHEKCKALLTEKKHEVGIVAEELLRKEVLTRDDMVNLLGPRPFPDKEEFAKYFSGARSGGKGDRDGRDSTIPGLGQGDDLPGGIAGNTAPPPAPAAFERNRLDA